MSKQTKARQQKPVFVEPNLDVLQIRMASGWEDYATVKTPCDLEESIVRVDTYSHYRLIRKCTGTVLYSRPTV